MAAQALFSLVWTIAPVSPWLWLYCSDQIQTSVYNILLNCSDKVEYISNRRNRISCIRPLWGKRAIISYYPPVLSWEKKNSSFKCLSIILARVSSKVNKASWSMASERVKGLAIAFNFCLLMTADHWAIRFPFLLSGSHRRTVPAEVAGVKFIKYVLQI